MAYNRGYNPDALPQHAEPDQAASMLNRGNSRSDSYSSRNNPSYANKPPPPPPVQSIREDRYGGRPSSPGGYRSPTTNRTSGGYEEYGGSSNRQAQGSRHTSYEDNRQRADSYSSSRYNPEGYAQRPPPPAAQSSRPPNTPVITQDGGIDREALKPIFAAVAKDGVNNGYSTGKKQLSEKELGKALVNGDYTSFDPHTVKMMIRMFDVDRSGTIDFEEFCGLWGFLHEWRKLFNRFDVDQSGSIELDEFSRALKKFGYSLSDGFVDFLFDTYARGRKELSFDLFVQSCISLKRMTDVFKKYDTDRDGFITLSFEQFLTGSQSLFLFNSISAVTDRGVY